MPFCTTSSAAATSCASAGLVLNECGSVLGLLSMAVTRTYLPPTCDITLAYSFSAPTATTTPDLAVAVAGRRPAEQAASRVPATARVRAAAIRRTGMRRLPDGGSELGWR